MFFLLAYSLEYYSTPSPVANLFLFSLSAHDRSIAGVVVDGDILITAGGRELICWDLTGELRPRCVMQGHTARVTSVAYSAEKKLLVSGGADGGLLGQIGAKGMGTSGALLLNC